MEFVNIREEKAVDALIEMMREGNHRKATVKLGELRGDPGKFMDLFRFLAGEGRLKDARIKINPVRAKVECLSCDWRGDPAIKENHVECPRCRGDVEVLRGHEFEVHL